MSAASDVSPNTPDSAASNAAATAAAAAAKKARDDTLAAAEKAKTELTGDPRKLTDTETKALFGMWGLSMVVPIVFGIIFASGAAYLSYQHFGALGWAALDFFFPQFYYPYYAFFLFNEPRPSVGLFGGRRRKH